jgi:hypothetical protein
MACLLAATVSRRFCVPVVLLMCVLYAAAGAQQETTSTGHPELLTNLFQLRQQAEHAIRVHDLRHDSEGMKDRWFLVSPVPELK